MTDHTDPPAVLALSTERSFRFGPSGGHGGHSFDLSGTAGRRPIGVAVRHGTVIDGIGLIWEGEEDYLTGGPGGILSRILFAEGEMLVSIHGRHGAHLDSLELTSSSGQTWAFGGEGGHHVFSFNVPSGLVIVGLFGRAGAYIDALGIVVAQDNSVSQGAAVVKKPRKTVEKVPGDDAPKPVTARASAKKKGDCSAPKQA